MFKADEQGRIYKDEWYNIVWEKWKWAECSSEVPGAVLAQIPHETWIAPREAIRVYEERMIEAMVPRFYFTANLEWWSGKAWLALNFEAVEGHRPSTSIASVTQQKELRKGDSFNYGSFFRKLSVHCQDEIQVQISLLEEAATHQTDDPFGDEWKGAREWFARQGLRCGFYEWD